MLCRSVDVSIFLPQKRTLTSIFYNHSKSSSLESTTQSRREELSISTLTLGFVPFLFLLCLLPSHLFLTLFSSYSYRRDTDPREITSSSISRRTRSKTCSSSLPSLLPPLVARADLVLLTSSKSSSAHSVILSGDSHASWV